MLISSGYLVFEPDSSGRVFLTEPVSSRWNQLWRMRAQGLLENMGNEHQRLVLDFMASGYLKLAPAHTQNNRKWFFTEVMIELLILRHNCICVLPFLPRI